MVVPPFLNTAGSFARVPSVRPSRKPSSCSTYTCTARRSQLSVSGAAPEAHQATTTKGTGKGWAEGATLLEPITKNPSHSDTMSLVRIKAACVAAERAATQPAEQQGEVCSVQETRP